MHKIRFFLVSLLLLIASQNLRAKVKINAIVYHTPLEYNHSEFREYSYISGLYTYLGIGLKHSLEFEVDQSDLDYSGGFNVKQTDLTAVYTYYKMNYWRYRVGSHFIMSDDQFTDKSYTFFAGIGRVIPYQWQAHVDFFATFYNDYLPKLKVYQATPRIGVTIGNRIKSSIYLETTLNYIHLSEQLKFKRRLFLSLQESISYFINRYQFKVYGWVGEQAFAVQQRGLLVYNAAELYKGGYGADITVNLTKKMHVTAGGFAQVFSDFEKENDATVTKWIIMLGYQL